MKSASIYRLIDPFTGKVRYIGKTTDVKARMQGHLSLAKMDGKTLCKRWIRSVVRKGSAPIMEEIERVSEADWQTREAYWIAFYRAAGARLCNHTDGGEGLVNPSEATKEKQRANNRRNAAKYKTPEFRAKISVLSKAMVRTPEHGARIAAAKRGKPRSAETIAKVAAAMRKPVGKFDALGAELNRYPTSKECAEENCIDRKWLITQMKRGRPVKGVFYKYI